MTSIETPRRGRNILCQAQGNGPVRRGLSFAAEAVKLGGVDMDFAHDHRTDAERLTSQRVEARGTITVAMDSGATRLRRLGQAGAAKIRIPRGGGPDLEAVLINTAGGLTGGDRLAWSAQVGAGGRLTLATQACEKVYRSAAGHAGVAIDLRVAQGGHVAWLPQETIVYDRSALERTLDARLADRASALIVEATVFGRRAMGERVDEAMFKDRWRIHQSGRLIHAEEFRAGPYPLRDLSHAATGAGAGAVATVLLVGGDAGRHLDAARTVVGMAGGVSFWTIAGCGKLLARVVAEDGYHLRRTLVPLLALLNDGAALPKVWSL